MNFSLIHHKQHQIKMMLIREVCDMKSSIKTLSEILKCSITKNIVKYYKKVTLNILIGNVGYN